MNAATYVPTGSLSQTKQVHQPPAVIDTIIRLVGAVLSHSRANIVPTPGPEVGADALPALTAWHLTEGNAAPDHYPGLDHSTGGKRGPGSMPGPRERKAAARPARRVHAGRAFAAGRPRPAAI